MKIKKKTTSDRYKKALQVVAKPRGMPANRIEQSKKVKSMSRRSLNKLKDEF